MKTLTAQSDAARFDVWLAAELGVSRAEAQRLIRVGRATLNDRAVTPHHAIKTGDAVLVDDAAPETAAATAIAPLDVIFEDADVMVVNKPSGMLVHQTPGKEHGTLAELAVLRHPEIVGVGEAAERPGIVHRLDKDASGVIVVARTQQAFESLKAQFQTHDIKKEYAVLVNGKLPKDEGTIKLAIGRSTSTGRMAARSEAREGDRDAVTHYHVDERFRDATLVTARTETGRTHQIRAHFRALGHPVVGDQLYAMKRDYHLEAPRLFLHAKTLGFTHPTTGKAVEFSAPLPQELASFLATLKTLSN